MLLFVLQTEIETGAVTDSAVPGSWRTTVCSRNSLRPSNPCCCRTSPRRTRQRDRFKPAYGATSGSSERVGFGNAPSCRRDCAVVSAYETCSKLDLLQCLDPGTERVARRRGDPAGTKGSLSAESACHRGLAGDLLYDQLRRGVAAQPLCRSRAPYDEPDPWPELLLKRSDHRLGTHGLGM
jgi:hypothetical protein